MYRVMEIEEILEVTENVRAFRFSENIDFTPGQFIMIWLPGVGEKPFSLAWKNMVMIKRVGPFTSKLFELKPGDRLWIRGPYGHGFQKKGNKIILIGGDMGIPPLYALARLWDFEDVTLLYWAENDGEIPLMDIENYVDNVVVKIPRDSRDFYTVLRETRGKFDHAYASGPETMLKAVLKAWEYRKVQVTMERYIKCGIGICGSCNLGKYLVCRDGPVFDGEKLLGLI
ncbi:dihydroorotate dehydrogenase electron transfer subunit [Thermococcus sp.]